LILIVSLYILYYAGGASSYIITSFIACVQSCEYLSNYS